jgi:voltage-gated potassium channel Kch
MSYTPPPMSSHGPGKRPNSKWGSFFWWTAIIAAVSSLALSIPVLLLHSDREALFPHRVLNAAYESGEILLLHYPSSELEKIPEDHHFHLLIIIARGFAVVFTAAGVMALALEFFLNRARLLCYRILGGNTVIVGFGQIGQGLVHQFQQHPDVSASDFPEPILRLVVIHPGEPSSSTERAAERGAALVEGNPADPNILRKALILRATNILFALDDDSANVGAALRALTLLRQARDAHARIYVHITDPQLRAMLRHHRVFSLGDGAPRTRIFNLYETSARLLLRDFPLDHVAISQDDPRSVLLVLVGFGLMGEAILVRSAMIAHYANGLRLSAVVIDRQAGKKQEQFRCRYPSFDQVCDLEFLSADADDISTHDLISGRCRDLSQLIPTVVIALDHDARALSLALALAPKVGASVPIRVRLSDISGLAHLGELKRLPSHISVFGSLRHACSPAVVIEGAIDHMARTFHEDYRRRMVAESQASPEDPNMRPWDELDDDFLDSNRQLADHIEVKLRAAGLHSAAPQDSDPSPPASQSAYESNLELLAKMEHQRWMAERFLAGWTLGPKDRPNRVTPHLVAWAELESETIRQYDRDFVQMIPGVLAQFGREIRQGRTPPTRESNKEEKRKARN